MGSQTTSGGDRDARLAELFTHYVDRLCAGEKLSREEIRRAHPDLAAELITELETLRGLGLEDEAEHGGQPVGGQIGGYRIISQIGRGGMGVVYKARDQAMGREVALKVLPPESLGDAKALARFVKEARIAGKLNHPAIVSVYGMGIENGTPWFAMEYGVQSRGFCKPARSAELPISLRTPLGSTASTNTLRSARLSKSMVNYQEEYGVHVRPPGSRLLHTRALDLKLEQRSTGAWS
ncbi:MAG: protein kinase [Planctomycetes bacterium]|nr:protein kinase [Planctomycetota bacterium]